MTVAQAAHEVSEILLQYSHRLIKGPERDRLIKDVNSRLLSDQEEIAGINRWWISCESQS